MNKVILICGKMCSGKTTYAKSLKVSVKFLKKSFFTETFSVIHIKKA